MIETVKEIKERKEYLVDYGGKHSKRIGIQRDDWMFYNDTFPLSKDIELEYQVRTGALGKAVDSISEHLVTDEPIVHRFIGTSEAEIKRNRNVSKETNRWVESLLNQVPNPYTLCVKYQLALGETWLQIMHNEKLAEYEGNWGDIWPNDVPVFFIPMHPLIMYLGEEDSEGNVLECVIAYNRLATDIHTFHPDWKPEVGNDDTKVKYWVYYNAKVRYAEADGISLFDDIENIYGFVPFEHTYSGFGMDTEEHDPSDLAMSYIRRLKGKARQQTTMGSDISMAMHKTFHKFINIINKSGTPLGEDAFAKYETTPYSVNEIILPTGAEMEVSESMMPDREAFGFYNQVSAELAMETPPILRGIPTGVGGRQEDIAKTSGLRTYNPVIRNSSKMWGRAIGKGLRMIDEKKVPNLLPPNLNKGDISGDYKVEVELKARDKIEEIRDAVDARTQYESGMVDFVGARMMMGDTQEEANDMYDRVLAEKYMAQNPDIVSFMGFKVAKEAGMLEEFMEFQAQRGQQGGEFNTGTKTGTQGGGRREENIQSAKGLDEADLTRGKAPIRRSSLG